MSGWHRGCDRVALGCHLCFGEFTSPICNYFYPCAQRWRFSREVAHQDVPLFQLLPAATSFLNASSIFFPFCPRACPRLQVHMPRSLPRPGAPGLPAEWEINGLPHCTWHLRRIWQRSGNRSRVCVITAVSCPFCNEVWSACFAQLLGNDVSLRHGWQCWISHPRLWFCRVAVARWVAAAPISLQLN